MTKDVAAIGRSMFMTAACGLSGILLTMLSWLALVGWDLSEVDPQGNATPGGGDDRWMTIAIVLAIVLSIGVTVALLRRPVAAISLTIGGTATWATLFAWRAATARVSGANMWTIPFLFAVLPAAFGVSRYVIYLARRRSTDT